MYFMKRSSSIDIIMIEAQTIESSRALSQSQFQQQVASLKRDCEGQCKIAHIKLIQFSPLKTILLIVPIIISIVGIFILKYYKDLRVKAFYFQSDHQKVTHLYIRGQGQRVQQIVGLKRQAGKIFFYYKHLKYQLLTNDEYVPVVMGHQKQLQRSLGTSFIQRGLGQQEAIRRRWLYDANQHIVTPPQYYEYMYEVLTQPFFFLQYLAAVIYIIQKLTFLAILLLSASIITTTVNYILLYISYRKIKQIAEVVEDVEVLRDKIFITLNSTELVPGDMVIPKGNIHCDMVLLRGEVYVDEANLTGESVPVGKFALEKYSNYQQGDNSKWIFEGSRVLSMHNSLAMVIFTGYSTRKGRILRKILHRTSATPHFFITCMYFLLFNYMIGVVLYLATLPVRLNNENLQRILIFLNFLLILTFCIPPVFPIYFNLVYSFSLIRLKWKNILGTQPQKTVEGAHLKYMAFDKTGTLTEDKMYLHRVYRFNDAGEEDITEREQGQMGLDEKLFGCCHSVQFLQQKLMGDEIDLKMFKHSPFNLCFTNQPGTCFQVTATINQQEHRLKVIKIHQYQSKHQSMSVMVYDKVLKKYFIFAKGAPEVIHTRSLTQYPYFDQLLRKVSYGGYRTIGYAFKEVASQDVGEWLNQTRVRYLQDLKMMGMLVFENKLKSDAVDILTNLKQANIQSCVITGDNVFIAIQTAIMCGIVPVQQQILLIQGKEQRLNNQLPLKQQEFNVKKVSNIEQNIIISADKLSFKEYLETSQPMVVDNEFLSFVQRFPDMELTSSIKVFARITPQNKALVIKTFKKQITSQRKELTFFDKMFSVESDKIGMVGDGANDLLAIKEADIGIGIRNSDSSYAANFTIENLMDIDCIVREAKNSQRIAIEIIRYISISSFLSVPLLIIMETEAVFFSVFQLIYMTATKAIAFPTLLALSRPANTTTPYPPSSNFLRIQNLLTFWGNVLIGTVTLLVVLFYYRSQDEYVRYNQWTSIDTGWQSQTSLVTAMFLVNNLYPVPLVFGLYQSQPWKEPIYKNYILFIFIIINAVLGTAISFLVPQLKDLFSFVDMSYRSMAFIYGIVFIAAVITIIYNESLISAKLYIKKSDIPSSTSTMIQLKTDAPKT